MTGMRFHKYHALGNDYLVLEPKDCPSLFPPLAIRKVCHRHYGLGSDGILYGPIERSDGAFGLRILNPDGSEAEKSGNGLRIFSRFLWDQGLVKKPEFTVETPGGHVKTVIKDSGKLLTTPRAPSEAIIAGILRILRETGTPPERVEILRAAFMAMTKTEAFKTHARRIEEPYEAPISGAELEKQIAALIANITPETAAAYQKL